MNTTRLGTSTNLNTGGTYDLLLIKFPDGYPEGQLIFNIDETPRKITGVQKVAQTFFKTLFTSRGSDVLYPNRGTDFNNLTINSNIRTTDMLFISDLKDQINMAESQVKSFLNTGTDTSSQLSKISLLGVDSVKDAATIYLNMTTGDGVTAQIAVPFPQLNLAISPTA